MENDRAVMKPESNLSSPAEMIRAAITERTDLDKLEKLLILQERFEANEARKAYHKAMALFKANPPKIEKDKKVGYKTDAGNVGYSHASLYNVTDKINSALSKFGLSATWNTKQNGAILVTCRITHEQGHSEETTLSAAADTTGSKNAIQALGSTISYLERYTLLALTGLATHDIDDDGKTAGAFVKVIGDKELHFIRDNLIALNSTEKQLCAYLKIEKLEDLLMSEYQKAVVAIEQKKKLAKKVVVKK